MSDAVEVVKLTDIRENPVALRTVNKQNVTYMGLVDSIRQRGFIGTISGRKKKDDAGINYIEIMDGLHRFAAAKDAGLDSIPVSIVDLDDAATMEAQLMLNVHKVETKPVQYSQQLRRILSMQPMMTEAELAAKLGKSPTWIKERLGLVKLPEQVAALVNEGRINLSNAYAMAKLPPEECGDWIERAMEQKPDEFIPNATARYKELKDAARKGKDATPAAFAPVAFMQKLGALKDELGSNTVGTVLIKQSGAKSAQEGWNAAIKWALHLDDNSVQAARTKHDEQQLAREEGKKKRKADRAAKKAEVAKKAADEAAAAAEA